MPFVVSKLVRGARRSHIIVAPWERRKWELIARGGEAGGFARSL